MYTGAISIVSECSVVDGEDCGDLTSEKKVIKKELLKEY